MTSRDQSCSWHRFEVKYLIPEDLACKVRAMCRAHLPLDPYSSRIPDGRYPILSTYLDSPDRRLLRATRGRRVRRLKLRVRTYCHFAEPPGQRPAFFEIKRKANGVVHKTRAKLPRNLGDALLWGNGVGESDLSTLDRVTFENLGDFLAMRSRLSARPLVGVYYNREAYECGGLDRVRITFDRDLRSGLTRSLADARHYQWRPVRLPGVILEIKFTNSYPFWVADLIRHCELTRRGICKYVLCSEEAFISSVALCI